MLPLVLVVAGAAISVLAFPPFGPGVLILPGVALILAGLRLARDGRRGLLLGAVFGLAFYGGLMWWTSELGLIASVPLILALAVFTTAYGWWVARHNGLEPGRWLALAVGSWAVMELVRYHFPFNGLEWGAVGYALSDNLWSRFPAVAVGTTGLTVLVVALAGATTLAVLRQWDRGVGMVLIAGGVVLVAAVLYQGSRSQDDIGVAAVAVVQGSTPCPFEHCPPNERLRTYQQHLALTQTIPKGSATWVVWSEGSTGSVNADPVQNPEVGESVGNEAQRIGSWFLVGSDRPISNTEWINANVVFDDEGEIVGEYRKQHPVPFGEYIPFRPLFEWIPALDQVPRDMIPGDGPVVFDDGNLKLGSVISFEGAFARYPRQSVAAGAEVVVVATNEASYGTTPASDQFIGMTRMRATELGVPVIHAAVTGKSTVIDRHGEIRGTTDLGTQEIFERTLGEADPTFYARTGDLLMYLTALVGIAVWWSSRSLVGSRVGKPEEE